MEKNVDVKERWSREFKWFLDSVVNEQELLNSITIIDDTHLKIDLDNLSGEYYVNYMNGVIIKNNN